CCSGMVTPCEEKRWSSPVAMFVMPAQCSRVGPLLRPRGYADRLSVQGVVMPTIFELLLDAAAGLEMQVRSHGHISCIEEAMEVAPEKQAVVCIVASAVAIGPDVSSL